MFSTDEPDPGVEPGVVDVGLYAGRELDVDDDDDVADVADVG